MKLKKQHEHKLTMIIMVLVMTMILSMVNVLRNNGLHANFIAEWLKAWGFAYLVALPTVMVVLPLTKKVVSKFVE